MIDRGDCIKDSGIEHLSLDMGRIFYESTFIFAKSYIEVVMCYCIQDMNWLVESFLRSLTEENLCMQQRFVGMINTKSPGRH